MGDVVESSQATPPEQAQMGESTQVEYLNYQDQIHHVTDGGYDQQHIPDGGGVQQGEGEDDDGLVLDADDIATQTSPQILLDRGLMFRTDVRPDVYDFFFYFLWHLLVSCKFS